MEIIYARGKATANDVVAAMADAPTRTTVRTILRILEEKGHLSHKVEEREFVYSPVKTPAQVGKSALKNVLNSFFANSLPRAVAAYLADPKTRLSDEEAAELKALIDQAKKRGA
jgi:BlaI family transcriptional regulator, penicillinase repressor